MTRANACVTAGAALLVLSGACNREPATGTDVSNPSATTAQAQPAGDADWWTTTRVQAKFFADPAVKGRKIDVDTTGGVVALRGQVESEAAKTRAVALAREVSGVTRVDDQLTVVPEPTATTATPTATSGRIPDTVNAGWITTKIQAQYYADAGIKPWNIDVTTQANGHVTLRGEVDDVNDKMKAVSIARATEGVKEVDDRLRVRGEPAGASGGAAGAAEPDAWITAKIESKYFLDDDVKGREIDVTTNSGVVTLTGQLESEFEHRRAVALARSTEGVTRVDDKLTVRGDAAAASRPIPPVSELAGATPDVWITTKIQSKYFLDPDVKGLEVNVDTRDGTVTLSGSVANENARRTAEQIAKETEGVTRVVNELTIR